MIRRYGRPEIERFLAEVNAALDHPTEVIVIGAAAAILQYGLPGGTQDIDTWTGVQEELATAVERARQATGLPMPFGQAGVADGPFDFESRLERALPGLAKLVVLVPERHDLVLMKLVRGYEHDLEAIEAIHQHSPLDLELLLDRHEKEMGAAIIDPVRLKGHVLAMTQRLFPEAFDAVASRLEQRGPEHDPWSGPSR